MDLIGIGRFAQTELNFVILISGISIAGIGFGSGEGISFFE